MKRILWENCFCKSRFNFESLRMFLECCIRHLFFGCGDCKVADLSFYYHRVERSRTKILLLYLRLETNAYIASGVRFLFFLLYFLHWMLSNCEADYRSLPRNLFTGCLKWHKLKKKHTNCDAIFLCIISMLKWTKYQFL